MWIYKIYDLNKFTGIIWGESVINFLLEAIRLWVMYVIVTKKIIIWLYHQMVDGVRPTWTWDGRDFHTY